MSIMSHLSIDPAAMAQASMIKHANVNNNNQVDMSQFINEMSGGVGG